MPIQMIMENPNPVFTFTLNELILSKGARLGTIQLNEALGPYATKTVQGIMVWEMDNAENNDFQTLIDSCNAGNDVSFVAQWEGMGISASYDIDIGCPFDFSNTTLLELVQETDFQ